MHHALSCNSWQSEIGSVLEAMDGRRYRRAFGFAHASRIGFDQGRDIDRRDVG
jgi:hypothetical protein